MRFEVLTLFPGMIETAFMNGVTGRAASNGIVSLDTVNIRDYCVNNYGSVDDYTYGGGAGLLMQAQPIYDC